MRRCRDGGHAAAVALSKGSPWHDARLGEEGRHERQDARRGGPGEPADAVVLRATRFALGHARDVGRSKVASGQKKRPAKPQGVRPYVSRRRREIRVRLAPHQYMISRNG
jgi:hypothetical protein